MTFWEMSTMSQSVMVAYLEVKDKMETYEQERTTPSPSSTQQGKVI